MNITFSAILNHYNDTFVSQKNNNFLPQKNFLNLGKTTQDIFCKNISFSGENKNYPADIKYKQQLLLDAGISGDYKLLNSVMGKEELIDVLKTLQSSPEVFSVGKMTTNKEHSKNYDITKDFKNVEKGIFRVSLHNHTTNSDGRFSTKEFLDICAEYANKVNKLHGKDFIIALTDHDSVNADKEAVQILASNPDKYKNLRVVLGIENTADFMGETVHLLSLGINPFVNDLNKDYLKDYHSKIQNSLDFANEEFKNITQKFDFKFSFDDLTKMKPVIKKYPLNLNTYLFADYIQFRTIFADTVENNKPLMDFLKTQEISKEDLDFTIPVKKMLFSHKKQPYWKNYTDKTKEYLKEIVKDKTKTDKYFKDSVDKDTIELIKKVDSYKKNIYNTNHKLHGLYIDSVSGENLIDVLNTYSKTKEAVSGIAHPCCFYSFGNPHNSPKNVIENLFSIFAKCYKGENKFYEGFYQDYKENITKDKLIHVDKLASSLGFIKTGGKDSHFNNPFTGQLALSQDELEFLLKTR